MIILPKTRICHIPKTGGTWIKKAIQNTNLPHVILSPAHILPQLAPGQLQTTICFVRPYEDWYKSYWKFKQREGWDSNNPYDIKCQHSDYHLFRAKSAYYFPQYAKRMQGEFVDGCDKVYLYRKNLGKTLIRALISSGESLTLDEQRKILATERVG